MNEILKPQKIAVIMPCAKSIFLVAVYVLPA